MYSEVDETYLSYVHTQRPIWEYVEGCAHFKYMGTVSLAAHYSVARSSLKVN